MQIACPHCTMSYQVNAYVIGVRGRTVRCVRCRREWFAAPPGDTAALATPATGLAAALPSAEAATGEEAAFRNEIGAPTRPREDNPPAEVAVAADAPTTAPIEEPESPDTGPAPPQHDAPTGPGAGAFASGEEPAAPETAPEPAIAAESDAVADEPQAQPPPALSDIAIPAAEAPPLVPAADEPAVIENGPEDIESAAVRRRARQASRRRRKAPKSRLPALILVLVAVMATLVAWRKDIVRRAPQMASLYAAIGLPVNLRGLVFQDVSVTHQTHDGVPVLVVEGKIASTAPLPVDVPRLRFALRNAAGAEIYAWTAVPAQPVLKPGETLPFRGRLASPPSDGQDVQVRFFTRRDAAGDIR